MANLHVLDGAAASKYMKTGGAGTDVDPHIPVHGIDQATANANEVVVKSITAGETHIGEVGSSGALITVTLSLDTNIYASGDVLADTQEVAGAVRTAAGTGWIDSIALIDIDDQKAALDLIFFNASTALGTENAAPDMVDANGLYYLGTVSFLAADYVDLGAFSVACRTGLAMRIKGVAAGTSIYVAAISRGTPTHSATGITLRIGVSKD